MRIRAFGLSISATLSFLLFTPLAAADLAASGWTTYSDNKYGFSMLMPAGTTFKETEFGDSWGALRATYEGIEFLGLVKAGTQATPEEIEAKGVQLTKLPANAFELLDEGEGGGWTWYRTVRANVDGKALFGGYGTGPKGSYLLLLKTTDEDLSAHQQDYWDWYRSIELW